MPESVDNNLAAAGLKVTEHRSQRPGQVAVPERRSPALVAGFLVLLLVVGYMAVVSVALTPGPVAVAAALGGLVLFALIGGAAISRRGALRKRAGAWKRSYGAAGPAWMSPAAYFMGPYDDAEGLPGCAAFFGRHGFRGKPPRGYLVVAQDRFDFLPHKRSLDVLTCRFANLCAVELFPGAAAHRVASKTPVAFVAGRVVLKTDDGRAGVFDGVPPERIAALLQSWGAELRSD